MVMTGISQKALFTINGYDRNLYITNSSTGLRNVCSFPAKIRSKVASITPPVSWALQSKGE
jgi:hypothetical protein